MVHTKLKLAKVLHSFSVTFFNVEKKATGFYNKCVLSEEGGQALQEIVVTGSRTPVRSNTKVLYQ
jgi:iron complex outermembrane receptor protein